MPIGAPWSVGPTSWSLDNHPLRVSAPTTTGLVRALLSDQGDKRTNTSGLWTALVLTDPADHAAIGRMVLAPGGPTLDLFHDVADALFEAVVGWHRWEAEFVWAQTVASWPLVDGDLLAAGVDVCDLPVSRSTNVAYSWWWRTLRENSDGWRKFEKGMRREPRRVIRREAEKPMDAAAFAQLTAQIAAASSGRVEVPQSTITMP